MKPYILKVETFFSDKTAAQRVLEFLYLYPDKDFSLSDLAKGAHVAKPNIGPILKKLEKAGIIGITRLSTIWRIRANQRSRLFIRGKIGYNLNLLYQSGLIDALEDFFRNPKAIILFGSFRWGDDISTSDIDIAVETEEVGEHTTGMFEEFAGFEQIFKKRIQIHQFNRKSVDANVFSNIANGIVLSGFLELGL